MGGYGRWDAFALIRMAYFRGGELRKTGFTTWKRCPLDYRCCRHRLSALLSFCWGGLERVGDASLLVWGTTLSVGWILLGVILLMAVGKTARGTP